ncbi:MAG: S-layer homology domain-containing protein, partial [Clostridia bacterium]|nr:S-layer homology domain-containing protein [Clostridia bacterium]
MKKVSRFISMLLVTAAIMNISFAAVAADNILYEHGNGITHSEAVKIFRYQHDPRLNNKAMEDIIINPDAIYGFSPSPTGSLAAYAEYDWTDAEAVETYRQNRIEYLQSYSQMYDILDEMTAEGKSIEEIARKVSEKRNELRLAAYEGNPEGLETVKVHNLEKYGHEDGPTADEMFEKYGSWEQVIEKAFSHNPGMDACVGLYDDNYKYYISFDYIEDERTAAASREYTVAAFMDAVGLYEFSDTNELSAFSDAEDISEVYAAELAQAVKSGIIKGYEDGTLRPKATICRVEALAILDRMLPQKDAVREAIAFSDVPLWAKASIDNLSAAGIVEGYGDGILGAYDDLTIEQIMLLTERITNQATATYLGVENYGEPETNKDNKNNFRYRFLIDGKETTLSIDNGKASDDGKYDYPIQNLLKEGYSYKLKISDNTVISAEEIIDNLEEFTPAVSGIPGEKTLLNFLKTAMEPVGTTLYIYGGGWDWQDVGSSVAARTIGVSPDWVRFFNAQDENFTYKE